MVHLRSVVQSFDMDLLMTALVGFGLCYMISRMVSNALKLRHIPTVGGSSLPLLSIYGAVRSIRHADQFVKEGYSKYKGGVFKHASLTQWKVFVSGPQLIEELRKASGDVFSLTEAAREILQIKHTIGLEPDDDYGIAVVRSQLTRNLGQFFPELYEEIVAAFPDAVLCKDGADWTRVCVTDASLDIISRTSSRMFVGYPLCRNVEFNNLLKRFTIENFISARIIGLFPDLLKPIVAKVIGRIPRHVNRAIEILEPLILERLQMRKQYEEGQQKKPGDLLQWLIDATPTEQQRTPRALVRRILNFNNAALHSSSITFAQVLVHLASHPQYALHLREEVECVVRTEGWTKAAVGNMHKVDSFIRESMRHTGLGPTTMLRVAMKDYTFSDGTFIPVGTFVGAATGPTHHDDGNYANADSFEGFRFASLREEGEGGSKHQLVTTNAQYLPWGHGSHACPGRFFAALELKTMLAHFVMEYDVRMGEESDGGAPTRDRRGKVYLMVRKRTEA